MKLIDMLVQELPKRGGWNENWMSVTQDSDGYLCCWRYDNPKYNGFGWEHMSGRGLSGYFSFDDCDGPSCDNAESIITRDQYQSALAASQKVEWSGDGLPPVGCECERKFTGHSDTYWEMIKILWAGDDEILYEYIGKNFNSTKQYHSNVSSTHLFRPLRSETDKKRDAAVESINYWMPEYIPDTPNEYYHAKKIYDAIAAGKIPGVKLVD